MPVREGKVVKRTISAAVRTPAERHAALTQAPRLKRVFHIEGCGYCGGPVGIITSIEDQNIIDTYSRTCSTKSWAPLHGL
jgi:hypothetical protein|tara:strand:+ start:723 stop:962 length:240 start_codon:yes stop_codon:yes gene_type:complete